MQKDIYFGMSSRIARWKLNTPFERWLSLKADASSFWKKIYLYYYCIFDHKYYVGGGKMAQKAISNHIVARAITDKAALVKDMIYCLHRFGISFQDYCIYDFANNSSLEYRNSFVSDKLRYYYCDILNDPAILPLMTNKYACYQKYKKFYKRDVVGCFKKDDEADFKLFLASHSRFIYKPIGEHSGHGIELVDSEKIDADQFFATKIKAGSFILEELIIQGKETSLMHPQSINSCRVVTFVVNGDVNIMGATWRVGAGDSIKDNAGSGGMYASINPSNGEVETDAISYNGTIYEKHPDTGYRFKGFHLPEWDTALSLVKEMSLYLKGTTLVSWDIAYSNKGWVMVEANDNGDWSIIQSNRKVGKKDMLYLYMDRYFSMINS